MISVKGIYDGKIVRPLERVDAKKNTEVIITFLQASTKASTSLNKRKADEALWQTFGAWKDIDAEKLINEIYASRSVSNRPEVKL